MTKLHSKTLQAESIEEIDRLCNEFSDTHDVKFVQIGTSIIPGGILHTRLMQYVPEEQKKDVKPDWYKCTTCGKFVTQENKDRYGTCSNKHNTLVRV